MKILNKIAVSILLLSSLTGCKNDDIPQDCDGDNTQYLETLFSEEFASIPCALQNIESNEKEVNLIITNQTELEKYFTCHEQLPEIDFKKYFVLAGRYKHHQCAMFDSQQIFICSGRITYKVRMLEQDCHAITSVFYATVIEKRYSVLPVDFDVRFKN